MKKKRVAKKVVKKVRKPFGSGRPKDDPPPNTDSKPDAPQASVRIPTNDPINEAMVIVAVIVSDKHRKQYLQSTSADYFYSPQNIKIWQALQMMFRKVDDYTPSAIRQFDKEIDTNHLESLVDQFADQIHNIKLHVDRMLWDRCRIEMAQGPLTLFMELLKDPQVEPAQLRGAAELIPKALTGFGSGAYVRDNQALLAEVDTDLRNRMEGKAIYPFGIPGLDYYGDTDFNAAGDCLEGRSRIVPGLFPGGITTVSGVSGSGKSTTLMNAMLGVINSGRSVLFGALEQGDRMTLQLMAAISLGMSRTDLMAGRFSDKDRKELLEECERLQANVRFFVLPFGKARGERYINDRNMDIIHQTCADVMPDVFVIDLFRRTLKETRPDDEEQALYRMQSMAQELKVHFILVQQQKEKAIKDAKVKYPSAEHILGSSAGWIGVSDTILLWYRAWMYKNVPDDKIIALIPKQRDGEGKLAVELDWNPEFGSVDDGKSIPYPKDADANEDDGFDALATK